jgi:hypothetical protein
MQDCSHLIEHSVSTEVEISFLLPCCLPRCLKNIILEFGKPSESNQITVVVGKKEGAIISVCSMIMAQSFNWNDIYVGDADRNHLHVSSLDRKRVQKQQ